jgi:hypothetical protein
MLADSTVTWLVAAAAAEIFNGQPGASTGRHRWRGAARLGPKRSASSGYLTVGAVF